MYRYILVSMFIVAILSGVFSTPAGAAYYQTVMEDSPVAYWRL